jgi:asparagine synthase (glutamine-hydrolysing)
MCGIVCAFDLKQNSETLRPQVLEMSKIIRHRGPDWSGILVMIKQFYHTSDWQLLIQLLESSLFSADGKF